MKWVPAAKISDCPPGSALEVVVDGKIVALFNVGGTMYALDGVCPHQGGPLGKGTVCNGVVTCPWHGWQFDVRTGQHQFSATVRQPTFPVQISGDEVLVGCEE